MARRALTPIGVVAKWLVVPVALGALGYFLLGPRLGQVAPVVAEKVAPENTKKQSFTAPDVDVDSFPTSRYANASPEVEVDATERKRKPRTRRRRTNPVVVEDRDTGRQPAETYASPVANPPVSAVDGA